MYVIAVMAAFIFFSGTPQHEARVMGRFRRDTSLSYVEAIYSRYKQQSHGEATYYGEYPGGGACALDPLPPLANQPGWIRVAAGREDFQNSLGCGMCLEITGSGKGKGTNPVRGTLKGIVHDLCGGCKQGDLDLYIPGDGRWEISVKSIDCPTLPGSDGNIIMRFTGSNPWYIKLQARNARVPVAGIEVLKNSKYSCLRRVNDNYFVGDGLGKVVFPMQVRLTGVNGEQRETIVPSMNNDVDSLTDVQFTGHETGNGPSTILCMGQGNKAPYPSGGMEPGGAATFPSQPSTGEQPEPLAPTPGPYPPSAEFCKHRDGGTYIDSNRCSGFIICNIGKTHRMACASGLMFNANGMNCDLSERVDCGSRPMDRPEGTLEKQFSDKGQKTAGSGDSDNLNTKPVKQVRIPYEYHGRKRNESEYLLETHSERLVKCNRENTPRKQLSKNHFSANDELKDQASSSSVILGVNLNEVKGEDQPGNDCPQSKPSNPSNPVVHVLINDRGKATTSMISQSADDSSKPKPSFEIIVDSNGVKASVGGGDEREAKSYSSHSQSELKANNPQNMLGFIFRHNHEKTDDQAPDSNSESVQVQGVFGRPERESKNSKSNFELMINNNKEQLSKLVDGHRDYPGTQADDGLQSPSIYHPGPNQEDRQLQLSEPVKSAQNIIVLDQGKQPGMHIELSPLMHQQDQRHPGDSDRDSNNIIVSRQSNNETEKNNITSTNVTARTNNQLQANNQDMEGNRNITQTDGKVNGSAATKLSEETLLLNTTQDDPDMKEIPARPFPIVTSPKTVWVTRHVEGLELPAITASFQHPLEASTYGQHALVSNNIKPTNSENYNHAMKSERNEQTANTGENHMTATLHNSEDQIKRPTFDILVKGGSGGTTELRMRNNNNEIAKLNDGKSSNRNPVIGITIRNDGSPDHHILFSKRQRLSNHKHQHHRHHKYN